MKRMKLHTAIMVFFVFPITVFSQQLNIAPANQPALCQVSGNTIEFTYGEQLIFAARVNSMEFTYRMLSDNKGECITQVLLLSSDKAITLEGLITASGQAFPCEAEPRSRGLAVVRHAYGIGFNRLNRAVYDRQKDWLLSIDEGPAVTVRPEKLSAESREFQVQASGREIVIRFRPHFYQKHKGLAFFKPWTYKLDKKPAVGWCSWFAFFDKVREEDIVQTADVLARVLRPFGYDYLQIDDGYQRGSGSPQLWLKTNEKFPRGLSYLADYIRKKGLKPGIWTNVAFNEEEAVREHPQWFVRNPDGTPASGNWIGYPIDGSSSQAIASLIQPLYWELRDQGWQYFKLDALRHLRYEGYNAHADYFKNRGMDRVEAFRNLVQAVRTEIGPESFLLACWGIRPELVGLIDACRTGTDGFSLAGLSQFNSLNNVVWQNDPDHIELSDEEAYRSCTATSLTGSLFMLTDRPERYLSEAVEPAKRAAPVLRTLPGQVYDLDPSRLSQLRQVDAEVSGSGPRVFDAGLTPSVHLYALEVHKPFESWIALARTGGAEQTIPFSDLGLDPEKNHLVFEFWSQRLLGRFRGRFATGPLDPRFNCQLFIIREEQDQPQVVATGRHVSGGGYDLQDCRWEKDQLRGSSLVTGRDPYRIWITQPQGFRLRDVSCQGAAVKEIVRRQQLLEIVLWPEKSGTVSWQAQFDILSGEKEHSAITLGTLVEEMIDLAHLTDYPNPAFRTVQFSSYDRRSQTPGAPGWFANNDGFGGEPLPNFEKVLKEPDSQGIGEYLIADVPGPGAMVRLWTAAISGSVRLFLDENPRPLYDGKAEDFFLRFYSLFPQAAALDSKLLEGTFYQRNACYCPVPFARRCRLVWVGKLQDIHFYHVQFRLYEPGTALVTFTAEDLRSQHETIERVARILADPDRNWPYRSTAPAVSLQETLKPGETKEILSRSGPQALERLVLKLEATDRDRALRQTLLSITMDDFPVPQVQAPLGDFFGSAPGINPYASVPFSVQGDGTMVCRFVMPFKTSCQIRLENRGAQQLTVSGSALFQPFDWEDDNSMHFYARWRVDHDLVASNRDVRDLPFLSADGQGVYVGTAIFLLNPNPVPSSAGNWWGEGDEKVFLDNFAKPALFGTGSEDYFNYAWSATDIFAFPYCGQTRNDGPANRGFVSDYRWHLLDPLPFRRHIRFAMELFSHEPTPGFSYGRIGYHYGRPGLVEELPPVGESELRPLHLPANWQPAARGAARNALFYQAEQIIAGRRHTVLVKGDLWAGGKLLVWHPGKTGETKEFRLPVQHQGNYRICITAARNDLSGKFSALLDSRPLPLDDAPGPCNLYLPQRTLLQTYCAAAQNLEPGKHRLALRYEGAQTGLVRPEIGIDFFWVQAVKEP